MTTVKFSWFRVSVTRLRLTKEFGVANYQEIISRYVFFQESRSRKRSTVIFVVRWRCHDIFLMKHVIRGRLLFQFVESIVLWSRSRKEGAEEIVFQSKLRSFVPMNTYLFIGSDVSSSTSLLLLPRKSPGQTLQDMNSFPLSPGPGHRRVQPRRSRNGCLTCKRRKVRCNERRPKCHHCQRLDFECIWKDDGRDHHSPVGNVEMDESFESNTENFANASSPSAALFDFPNPALDLTSGFSFLHNIYLPDLDYYPAGEHTLHENEQHTSINATSPSSGRSQSLGDRSEPVTFSNLQLPPILDPIEHGPKCASARALLIGMATSSPMVHHSIAAFEAIQSSSLQGKETFQRHYDKASNELSLQFQKIHSKDTIGKNANELKYVLVTIFFLTYTNVCRKLLLDRNFLSNYQGSLLLVDLI